MTEPPISRPLPSKVRVILGLLVVVGAAVIGAAWKVADGPFLDDLLLAIGGGVLLFAALFWLEEGLRRQMTAVRRDAQAAREGVVKIGEEALAIVKRVEDVEQAAAETKARLDDLSSLSKQVMEQRAEERQALFDTVRGSLTPRALRAMLDEAIAAGAISTHGFRVQVPNGPAWIRFQPSDYDDSVEIRSEFASGKVAHYADWRAGEGVDVLIKELATLIEAAGAGSTTFDAAPLIETLVHQARHLTLVRMGVESGVRNLDPAIELPTPQWAITMYGLEATEKPYRIEWARIDEPDWNDHIAGKEWADLSEFQYALDLARRMWPHLRNQPPFLPF